jgi:hypothetical protein
MRRLWIQRQTVQSRRWREETAVDTKMDSIVTTLEGGEGCGHKDGQCSHEARERRTL